MPRLDTRPDPRPQVWAGFECARVRVRGRVVDQLELTGHAERPLDIDLLPWLGVSAVRYPLLWGRIAPDGVESADWGWPDERLSSLRDSDIRPVVGLLHHGGEPERMSLGDPAGRAAFARYAGAVARRYPWVDTYLPVNEPLTTARFAGLYGFWQPHARSEAVFARLLLEQCLAIRSAMEAIREVRSDARLIVNDDVGRTGGTPELRGDIDHLNERRWLTWDLLHGRVDQHHRLWPLLARSRETATMLHDLLDRPCPPDIIGVDHYVTSDRYLDHRLDAYPSRLRPRPGGPRYVDVEAARVGGAVVGGVATAIQDTWRRYGQPIALTEVALAGETSDQVAWWREAWGAATDATRAGIRVEAVTAWSVVGATGWDRLLCSSQPRYEPGYFDGRFDPPRPQAAAHAVRESAGAARNPTDEIACGNSPGWWRREDRYLWRSA
jgi:dTDP-4-dehydrorhamnose reductase